ncbi:MAG: prephenate dehydratase [Corynebacterium sp.]|nr:prephenate dehydratase [Corynebacterium sp.]
MAASKSVAYLGPAGTFTEIALRKFEQAGILPGGCEEIPETSPSAVLSGVSAGTYTYGVVPAENSVDGSITATADGLLAGNVRIHGEVDVPIAFAAMTRDDVPLEQVTTFTTHPVAYAQLKKWIAEHLPNATYVEASSNGAAARMVSEGEAELAFAPVIAADTYGLTVRAEGLADYGHARTRFFLVANASEVTATSQLQGAEYRSMVIVSLKHEPGSLVNALQEFSTRNIDLTRIESRPTREVFGTYYFFLDVLGHAEEPNLAEALEALKTHSLEYVFLGSWIIGQDNIA